MNSQTALTPPARGRLDGGRLPRDLFDALLHGDGPAALPLRALVTSRLLIVLAGVASVLWVPHRSGFGIPAGVTKQLGPVANALVASAVRSDAFHYLAIADYGYTHNSGDPVFFPLYPLLIHVLGFITGSILAGVLISVVSFAIALVLLHRLTELELGKPAANTTVLIVAFAPLSFFFSAVYTEALFLALSVGAVYAARRQRWALAGMLAALATVTRATGVLLLVPLVIIHLRSRPRQVRGLARPRRARWLAWMLLVPAALAAYLAFLAASGFDWLAPMKDEARPEWDRRSVGPFQSIAWAVRLARIAINAILHGQQPFYHPTRFGPLSPSGESVFLLLVLIGAVVVLALCFRRLPIEYGAYSAVVLIVLLWSPVYGQPLVSLDRYLLTIFPLWMAGGAWITQHRLTRVVLPISAALLAFYTVHFASWAFVA